jgi:hypothetical protein
MEAELGKREFLTLLGAMGLGGLATAAQGAEVGSITDGRASPAPMGFPLDFPGKGPIPWFKNIYHLYSGPDGLTRAEKLPVDAPKGQQIAQLLRRTAYRVTIGGSSEGAGFDFHVAMNPTLLIPIFGTMNIELHDGTIYPLVHGDLAYAEDCTGKGHISRSGKGGSFMVSVQLPKEGCPKVGSSNVTKIWRD